MSFQIYLTSPSDGIVLPNPELGDARRLDTQVLNRETRGGEYKSFKDSDWPVKEIHVYEWPLLDNTERDNLEAFFVANAGEAVHIIDHNSDEWDGVFLTDVLDIRVSKDDCTYATSLEFLGVKA